MVRVLLTILTFLALLAGNASAGGSAPLVTGGITGIHLQSTSGPLPPGATISFGHAFARGDVPAGTGLIAMAGGQAVPLQVDVKASYADGSVRHAILTLVVPERSGNALDVTLNRGNSSGNVADSAQVARDLLARGYDLKVELAVGGETYTADAADALSKALSQGLDVWMKGDLASEFRVHAAITDAVLATFDIRAYAGGGIHTDVIISNDWITSRGGKLHQPDAVTYDVAIKQNGQTVFSHDSLNHHQNANWRTQIWGDGRGPAARVIFDVDYLAKTGAVPALDLSVAVNESSLQRHWNALQEADTGPMGSALWTTYMPTSGGRPDIGMVTGWQAWYLISQDPRAEDLMMKGADVAGSVPWHLRDAATGRLLTIDNRPGFSTGWMNGKGADAFATPYTVNGTGWTPDSAHQPAMSYVPYLFTGNRYHLDELQAEANWHLVAGDAGYRGGADGLFHLDQIRGQAWALRSIGQAALITPDGDPLKDYFTDKINKNIIYQLARNLSATGEVEGYIFDHVHKGFMAPWQDDFYTAVIAQLLMQGTESAAALVDWKVNFTAGRFMSEHKGFNPLAGSSYYMAFADAGSNPWRLFDNWAEVYNTFVAEHGVPTTLLANYVGGYADVARGTLATLITATGDPRAIEAYGFLVGETQHTFVTGVGGDPTWSIAPRLADGGLVQYDGITVGGDGGETLTGAAGSQLLHGKAGNDTTQGGAGSDLLFGGDGDDVLYGGEDDDHLFGGKGADTLMGGPGSDVLKGNEGADRFPFTRSGDGRDTIADFEPRVDRLKIPGFTEADAQSLIAKSTADQNGNAVLPLTPNDAITLLGIGIDALRTSFFLLR